MAALRALCSCVLLLLLPHTYVASTTLQDKCESFVVDDPSSYDYCVRTLQHDGASATADARGLAARPRARLLGRVGLGVRRRRALARDATRAGDLQRAQTLLAEVTGAPACCDSAFKAAGQFSPPSGADLGLDDEVELAIALLPSPTRA